MKKIIFYLFLAAFCLLSLGIKAQDDSTLMVEIVDLTLPGECHWGFYRAEVINAQDPRSLEFYWGGVIAYSGDTAFAGPYQLSIIVFDPNTGQTAFDEFEYDMVPSQVLGSLDVREDSVHLYLETIAPCEIPWISVTHCGGYPLGCAELDFLKPNNGQDSLLFRVPKPTKPGMYSWFIEYATWDRGKDMLVLEYEILGEVAKSIESLGNKLLLQGSGDIYIHNELGQLVMTRRISAFDGEVSVISLDWLPQRVYYATFVADNIPQTIKFMGGLSP